jgi:hypothetical protein
MNSIDHRISKARPRLILASPLTAFICWGYAGINLMLGTGIFFFYAPTGRLTVVDWVPVDVWGLIFFGMGLAGLYGLVRNSWDLIRRMQLMGLVVKAWWAIALVLRCIEDPRTVLITTVWLFFAYVQFGAYMFFLPNSLSDHDGRKR